MVDELALGGGAWSGCSKREIGEDEKDEEQRRWTSRVLWFLGPRGEREEEGR